MDCREFLDGVVGIDPLLKRLKDEHVKDNDGLLPHLLMADILRFAIGCLEYDGPDGVHRKVLLANVLRSVEQGLVDGDETVKDVIKASFVENLWQAGGRYEQLRGMLGPNIRADLDARSQENGN